MKRDLIQQHDFFFSLCLMLMLLLLLLQTNNGIKIFRYGQKRYSTHSLHSLFEFLFCFVYVRLFSGEMLSLAFFFPGFRYLCSMGEREWLKMGETNIISLFTGSAISGHFNNCIEKPS